MAKFNHGDMVKVISGCQTTGMVGVVIKYTAHPCGKYVQVNMRKHGIRQYNEASLIHINGR